MSTEAAPFSLSGTLPGPGVTVLEASAGTGKTYTLTSLVVRYVAAGTPLHEILAVTFTRMATGEIRDRIRERMAGVHGALSALVAGTSQATEPSGGDDPVLAALAEGAPAEAEARRERLGDALAEFDSATIATTHGFCQMVLRELGSAGDTAPDARLLEDPSDLLDQVVDDLYVRWALGRPPLPFARKVAAQAAFTAARNPDVRVVPDSGSDPSGLLGRLAVAARTEASRRLQSAGLLTYDDLLHRLAQTLADRERGDAACSRLRRRYSVILVDEFQDTDPSQWEVLRRAFATGGNTLILIGDPKQAIYAFRGADVYAYLDARAKATSRFTLDRNWRADQGLLDATAALLDPLQFGHEGIRFRPVGASPGSDPVGLAGAPVPEPLRARVVRDSHPGIPVTARGLLQKPALAQWVASDVASDVACLLDSGATIPARPGPGAARRPLTPGDIAVLTRTNRQALLVREALRHAAVPSVIAGLDSVFASEAAAAWLHLLEATQEPSSRSRVAAVALGPFMGMDPAEVATSDESRWEAAHDRVHRWAAELASRGVASLYRSITVEQGLPAGILATVGGERLLTDLGHVAQLLHAESSAAGLSAPALRTWLRTRIRSASGEQTQADERSRRMESDAEAVQVLTIHRAKGLEFPVVYCPYLWDAGMPESRSGPVLFHDLGSGGNRSLDVGWPSEEGALPEAYRRHAALARDERRGEDLRLLYVALTRARHQLVIWWGRAKDSRSSPLGRLLSCRDPATGRVDGVAAKEPTARQVRTALEAAAGRVPGLLSVEDPAEHEIAAAQSSAYAASDGSSVPDLRTARFERSLDRHWRRSSYTSITAAAHGDAPGDLVGSEPEDSGVEDEPPSAPEGRRGATESGTYQPSPFGALPGGRETGTLVHRTLERCDFTASPLSGELTDIVTGLAGTGMGDEDRACLVTGLLAALTTPLGPLLPGLTLSRLERRDRLDELAFEFPVAGGDVPIGEVRTSDIASLLANHLGDGGPLSGYSSRLADPLLATSLRGYLTGSLDLVLRARTSGDGHRWFVADYKTNWLGEPGVVPTLWQYRPAALDAEMQRRHYPLQALLYLVALHRYLHWRLPGYKPERDLGGVVYLFLRGMAGPDTPEIDGAPAGVFSWAPDARLVVEMSELLGRGGARR